MLKLQTYTKNRQLIHDLLYRAKTFHMPVSTCHEFDCTNAFQLLRQMKSQGQTVSFSAFLVKATAHLLSMHPHLNSHLFTKWSGRKVIAQFDETACNMIVQREGLAGEKILLPLVIKSAEKMPLVEIEAIIQHHKNTPLQELPQFQNFEKIKRMPTLLLKFISYKTRSDPHFYLKYYGTYGLSTLYSFKSSTISGSTVANTAVAFLPYGMVVNDKRRILRMGMVMDHYVLDGQQMVEAGYHFKRLIEHPEKIFP